MSTKYHPIRHDRLGRVQHKRLDVLKQKIADFMSGPMRPTSEAGLRKLHQSVMAMEGELQPGMSVSVRDVPMRDFNNGRSAMSAFGDNIFDVAGICHLFRNTDVEDVDLIHVDLPYPAFYIHFGEEAGLHIEATPRNYIEGAYVMRHPEEDAIILLFSVNFENWHKAHEQTYAYVIGSHTYHARAALVRSLSVKEALDVTEGMDGDKEIYDNPDLVRDALRIVVNSLLYISSPKADIEEDYPSDAPPSLVGKAAAGKPKAMRELRAMGFVKVKLCGRNITESDAEEHRNRTVGVHWRRGHWRRVVHGVGRADRRWHWFLPVLVNRGLGEQVAQGRVYTVGP